jgi:hypothetical protein
VTKRKTRQPTSTRHDVKLYADTRTRLNTVKDYFGVNQSQMVDDAIASHLILKGITYDDILREKLATLIGTNCD